MTVKNLAASVQGRLQKRARETNRPFQELLQYFAMERFLYRLSKSPHRSRFILKGALMLFGDIVTPGAETITYPALLDFPAAELSGYPRETVVAEKFQAMVYLRTVNSRMKDLYDIWLLAGQFSFDGKVLAKAVNATFANREIALDVAPIAFTLEFTAQSSTLAQWSAFRSRLSHEQVPERLSDVVTVLATFLLPVARACTTNEAFEMRWSPGGPWVATS